MRLGESRGSRGSLFIGARRRLGVRAKDGRRGAVSGRGRTRESPGPSRARGRPRQEGPACRWAAGGGGVGVGLDEEMGRARGRCWAARKAKRAAGEGNGRAAGEGKKNAGPAWSFRLKEVFFFLLQEIQTDSI